MVNPTLGTDFLSRHTVIIDCANRVQIDSTTNCEISLDRSHKVPELYNIHLKDFEASAQQIIEKYPKETHPMQQTDSTQVQVPVKHYIETAIVVQGVAGHVRYLAKSCVLLRRNFHLC